MSLPCSRTFNGRPLPLECSSDFLSLCRPSWPGPVSSFSPSSTTLVCSPPFLRDDSRCPIHSIARHPHGCNTAGCPMHTVITVPMFLHPENRQLSLNATSPLKPFCTLAVGTKSTLSVCLTCFYYITVTFYVNVNYMVLKIV